eukprot:6209352-Pleurochrysis_carterae.AAC.2
MVGTGADMYVDMRSMDADMGVGICLGSVGTHRLELRGTNEFRDGSTASLPSVKAAVPASTSRSSFLWPGSCLALNRSLRLRWLFSDVLPVHTAVDTKA